MKTTHQFAQELLALPDVPCLIEGWVRMRGRETVAVMTGYDPEGTAIIMQAEVGDRHLSKKDIPSP